MKTSIIVSLAAAAAMTVSVAQAATQADYDAAKSAANQARKGAAAVGFEWRDTGKMLKKADAAAAKGDFAKAIKLANAAKMQGSTAIAQANLQAKQWMGFVPK